MSNEKERIAEELFPQKTMPYSRLKREFLTADYAIEVREPMHWVISKTVDNNPIVIDVKFTKSYPFEAPHMIVLSPKPFILKNFGSAKLLSQVFDTTLRVLKEYSPPAPIDPPPHIQEVIDLAKRTEKPIHLVMGSHPGENPVGRTIYSNPQIFLLDTSEGRGDTSRFFRINFTNLQQMSWLCSQLPGAFETVIIDTSTMKFFTPHPDNPEDQLKFLDILACIYRLLSNTGIFFITEPGSAFGGILPTKQVFTAENKVVYVPNERPQAGKIMKEMAESVGFQADYKNIEEIDHSLVDLVHRQRTDGYGARYFLVAKKKNLGGKRKTRRRKMNKKRTTKRR